MDNLPPQNMPPVAPPQQPFQQEPEPHPGYDYIPMPLWVKGFAVLTLVIFGLALTRAPGALSLGVKYRRGQIAMEESRPEEAVRLLQPIADAYPDDIDSKIDLMDALIKDKKYEEAAKYLDSCNGREIDDDEQARLKNIESELDSALGPAPDNGATAPNGGSQQ